MRTPPDPDLLLRALKFTRIPGKTVAEACTRYGVSRGALQRARRERAAELVYTERERLLTAVAWFDGRAALPQILGFLDWIDHSVYQDAEVRPILDELVATGLLEAVDIDTWALRAEWP
ncbi:MAG: hypothetical protein V4850_07370 [Myxococcota bacterium]